MAKQGKLKVYRTPTGFHDAYVAAPSKKAALEAWGSDKDLFARGVAELVTDSKLMEEPLSRPGEVIKRLRGTAAEQIAALPPSKNETRPAARSKAAKPKPRPSRDSLGKAEEALADAEARHAFEIEELDAREAALKRERKQTRTAQAEEAARLERALEKAKSAYDAAIEKWAR